MHETLPQIETQEAASLCRTQVLQPPMLDLDEGFVRFSWPLQTLLGLGRLNHIEGSGTFGMQVESSFARTGVNWYLLQPSNVGGRFR